MTKRKYPLNRFFSIRIKKTTVAGMAGLWLALFGYGFIFLHGSASCAAVPESGPRFDDRAPHEWTSDLKPWHYPVHGTDVSKHKQAVDWPEVSRNNISFAYIKATEGGDRLDEYFNRNWEEAKKAGIPRGAYHFYYFCRPAADQARWFIQNVPKDKAALPPVLDMEWNPKSPTCKLRPPAGTVRKDMKTFLDMLEKHYGKRPIIYTTVDFFDDNALNHFKRYSFWLRSVADHPQEKYRRHPWIFWQYTSTGKISGIDGDADINVFAGSVADWKKWLTRVQK